MIRKTIFAALVLLVSVPAFAQTAKPADAKADFTDEVVYDENLDKVVTNSFWNNWFISVGGGVQFYFGDHERQLNFKELVSPAIDVAVGKWFSPEIGARLMYSGFAIRGATQSGVHSLGTPIESQPWDGKWLENSRFGFYNIHADVLFNLSNIIGGYKTRVYNISPYVGLGVIGTRQEPKTTEVAVNGGIMNTFRVSPALDINLDIRGLVTTDNFDGEVGGRSGEGLLAVTVGLTYKFKERGWERPKTVIRYDNRESNILRSQIEAHADAEHVPQAAAGPLRPADVVEHPQQRLVPGIAVPSLHGLRNRYAEGPRIGCGHGSRPHGDANASPAPVVGVRHRVRDGLPQRPQEVRVVPAGQSVRHIEPRAYDLGQPVDHEHVEVEEVPGPVRHPRQPAERPFVAPVRVLPVVESESGDHHLDNVPPSEHHQARHGGAQNIPVPPGSTDQSEELRVILVRPTPHSSRVGRHGLLVPRHGTHVEVVHLGRAGGQGVPGLRGCVPVHGGDVLRVAVVVAGAVALVRPAIHITHIHRTQGAVRRGDLDHDDVLPSYIPDGYVPVGEDVDADLLRIVQGAPHVVPDALGVPHAGYDEPLPIVCLVQTEDYGPPGRVGERGVALPQGTGYAVAGALGFERRALAIETSPVPEGQILHDSIKSESFI